MKTTEKQSQTSLIAGKTSNSHDTGRTHDWAEFGAILARELPTANPHMIGVLASSLRREARYFHGYAEAMCNREIEPHEEKSNERRRTLLKTLLASLGCGAIISQDPRGCCLKLTVPSGFTNDWGREGVCVPME